MMLILADSSHLAPSFRPDELNRYTWRQGECIVAWKKTFPKKSQALELRRFVPMGSYCFRCTYPSRTNALRIPISNVRDYRPSTKGGQAHNFVMNAIPLEVVSAVVTIGIVGASVATLIRLNQDKLSNVVLEKPKCEACNGSGLCSSCNGDGFLMKTLTEYDAARARANAKDAATRYTAGLAKKWSYCTNCSGSRGCPACQGRGWS